MSAAIRAAIVNSLQAVAGIGSVHDRERFAAREKDLAALYLVGGKLAGCHVRRVSVREVPYSTLYNTVHTRWRISLFASFLDAESSEILFDDLVDRIRAKFRNSDLGGLVESIGDEGEAGVQLDDSGPVMFSGVLCHGARLSLTTRHKQPKSEEPDDATACELSGVEISWNLAGTDSTEEARDSINMEES